MSNDTAGHPQVDFVWGNAPMQPNTERGVNVLEPLLDSHEIAYLGWNGYPGYVPNTTNTGGASGSGSGNAGSGSGGGVTLVTVNNYVGQHYVLSNVYNQIMGSGLTVGTVTENPVTSGALSVVTSQSIPAGTQVPLGTALNLTRAQDFYTALLGPTSNWEWNGAVGRFVLLGSSTVPAELVNSLALSYKLVITGGASAGEYAIGAVTNSNNVGGLEIYLPGGFAGSSGAMDGSQASVIHV